MRSGLLSRASSWWSAASRIGAMPPDLRSPCSDLGRAQQNGETQSTTMHTFSAVIERCPETGLLVGYVPGFPGAHSQGETLDELQGNLEEVISMLLEDGEPALESDVVGLQQISVPA